MPAASPSPDDEAARERERLLFHFVREAPRLIGAAHLGITSAPVVPWPHQLDVIRRSVAAFPRGFLFCDEVGLGKTVEAALTLRQLLISGRVSRVLILVPKALLRQWQEELHEKAALEVPLFDGRRCLAVDGREYALRGRSPWEAFPVLLASSQMLRRKKRQDELKAAPPWDLLIVDEAHHARRTRGGRPNRLLELLMGGRADRGRGLKDRTRCLYLLTATPMQVDPVELWDLLRLVGLGGAWGAREEDFLRYFAELRRPAGERDPHFLAGLLRDALEMAALFPGLEAEIEEQLSRAPVYVRDYVARARRGEPSALGHTLAKDEQEQLDGWLRALTPVRFLIWRSTRRVLRAYQAAGRLETLLPEREPENIWIDLRPDELRLYRRIDDYLARHYLRFEAKRPGLGFVMTLYRRRLTSSFYAVQKSLERRRAFLRGEIEGETLFGEIEDELDEAETATAAGEDEGEAALFEASTDDENEELEALLAALSKKRRDTKLDLLRSDLQELVGGGRFDRALVFTQYLDTLDFLRQALLPEWSIATYSGRGGELARGGVFEPCAKEALKEAFARGEIRLLICTDAASEGLNLQSCGLLINYDMPWNPMRVEQRIGRIDRLGQVHARIVVRNYFYSDTVEAEIYRRLAHRIGFFQEIVGPLQPILHRLSETVQRLAMVPEKERGRPLAEDLAALEKSFEDLGPDPLDVGRVLPLAEEEPPPPVSAAELERLFTSSLTFGPQFQPDAELEGAYLLRWRGPARRVTFRREIFALFPYQLELLTWGQPLFSELLASLPPPVASSDPGGLGHYACRNPFAVGLFLTPRGPVERLEDLLALDLGGGSWSGRQESEAATVFSRARRRVLQGLEKVEAGRRQAERQALLGAARQLLVESAHVELARARNPGIFDAPLDYGFGEEAVAAQAGNSPAFAELVRLVRLEAASLPEARAEDPQFLKLAGYKPGTLEKRKKHLEAEAEELARKWRNLLQAEEEARNWARDPSEGLLERAYFLGPARQETTEVPFIQPAAAFEGAIPFYEDLAEAGRRFLEAIAEGADPQAEEKRNPEHFTWLKLESRHRATSGLFAARAPGGETYLFRLGSRPPRPGLLLLVSSAESGCGLATLKQDRGRMPILHSAEEEGKSWPLGEDSELVVLAYQLERLA